MAWKITKDKINEGDASCVGLGQFPDEGITGELQAFRLLDDDEVVYYHGVVNEEGINNDMEYGGLYQAFQWGMSDSGTVDLQLLDPADHKWESIYA